MCRLSLLNKQGFAELEKKYGVVKFFDYLEKMNGGQGNGYSLIKDGQVVGYDKGVKLSNKDIVDVCKHTKFDWLIYHTRIVSKGNICDEQCHPFISPKGDFLLAMNGTESSYGVLGTALGTSDTDALFRAYHALNVDVSTLKRLDSRFIGFKKENKEGKGKVFITNPMAYYNSLELMKVPDKDKAIVIASCFPVMIDSVKVESGYHWTEGEKLKTQKVKYTKYESVDDDYTNAYIANYNKTYNITNALYECNMCGNIYTKNGYLAPFGKANKWVACTCEACGGDLEKRSLTAKEYNDMIEYAVD